MTFWVGQKIWNNKAEYGAPVGLYEVVEDAMLPAGLERHMIHVKLITPAGPCAWKQGTPLLLIAENCEDNFTHVARTIKEKSKRAECNSK